MTTIIPKNIHNIHNMTATQQARELASKKRAWHALALHPKYERQSLEWYASDAACSVLVKHLVKREPLFADLVGRVSLDRKRSAWSRLISPTSSTLTRTHSWYSSPDAMRIILPHLIKYFRMRAQTGGGWCDMEGYQQHVTSGTCWLNTIINGIILSNGMRQLFAQVVFQHLEQNANDAKLIQQPFLEEEAPSCPWWTDVDDNKNDEAARTLMFRLLYNVLCVPNATTTPQKTHDFDTITQVAYGKNFENTFKQSYKIVKIIAPDAWIVLYNPTHMDSMNIYDNSKLLYPIHSTVQINQKTIELTVIHRLISFPIMIIRSLNSIYITDPALGFYDQLNVFLSAKNQRQTYTLEFVSISLGFYGARNGHQIVGYKCGGKRFLYDSARTTDKILEFDWSTPYVNAQSLNANGSEFSKWWYSDSLFGIITSVRVSMAFYVRDDAVANATEYLKNHHIDTYIKLLTHRTAPTLNK